jgi:hypothetical protein
MPEASAASAATITGRDAARLVDHEEDVVRVQAGERVRLLLSVGAERDHVRALAHQVSG